MRKLLTALLGATAITAAAAGGYMAGVKKTEHDFYDDDDDDFDWDDIEEDDDEDIEEPADEDRVTRSDLTPEQYKNVMTGGKVEEDPVDIIVKKAKDAGVDVTQF